ncbi:MAG: sensor protein [Gemmatimonadetes bacterium]|nr:sensor protein [Gemmatimonadota bacterium]
MQTELLRTGISVVGDAPWGLHFSLFYETEADLLEVVVPYLAAGLESNELCMWAPSENSTEQASLDALRERVPDLDQKVASGALQLYRYQDFFNSDGEFDIALALAEWKRWEQRARDEGFAGLRVSGALCWVARSSWAVCHAYEQAVHSFIVGRKVMVLCSYPLSMIGPQNLLDTAREHHFVMARRHGEWDVLEIPTLRRTKEELQWLNDELEKRVEQRNAQLTETNRELRREIEERRRVEDALRRSETYLQHGQHLSHTGSFAASVSEGNPTFWSAETFRIFGLKPRARPPSRDELISLIHPGDRARVEGVIDDIVHDRLGADVQFRIVRPDGNIRYVRAVSSPPGDRMAWPGEFVGSVIDITEQKRAAARLLRVKRGARERMLRARFAAVLEERTRLARDIHDTLLQGVTGISLQLRATLPNLGAAPPPTVEAIRHIVELAESTIRDARRAVWDIRVPALARSGLPTALEEEVSRRANGAGVHFVIRGVPRPITAVAEDTIFRVGQEAVLNAARHAGARSIRVALAYEPRRVRLTVEDDGRGFRVDPVGSSHGGRWGLLGMRERAERIDGRLEVRSAEGTGTRVELVVPIGREALRGPAVVPRRPRIS